VDEEIMTLPVSAEEASDARPLACVHAEWRRRLIVVEIVPRHEALREVQARLVASRDPKVEVQVWDRTKRCRDQHVITDGNDRSCIDRRGVLDMPLPTVFLCDAQRDVSIRSWFTPREADAARVDCAALDCGDLSLDLHVPPDE